MEYARDRRPIRIRPAGNLVGFALVGAVSGSLATLIIHAAPEALDIRVAWLRLSPLSLAPGLVFGLLIGGTLYRGGLATAGATTAYVAASTLSYLAAYTLAMEALVDAMESYVAIGMIAGLFGGACLTAVSAALLPFARRLRPCLLMPAAGCLLGGLLDLPLSREESYFWPWLIFFALWQAGYAAGLGSALPRVAAGARDAPDRT